MSAVLFLVPSLVSGFKKGVVHSLWCATKVNFVAAGGVFFRRSYRALACLPLRNCAKSKACFSPHNQVQHLTPTRPRCYRVVSGVHGVYARKWLDIAEKRMIGKNVKIFTAVAFFVAFILARMIVGPVTCASGWQSPSLGKRGACSHHGGVSKWKAYLPFLVGGVASLIFYINFNPSSAPRKEDEETPKAAQDSSVDQPAAPPEVKNPKSHGPIIKCPKCRSSMVLRTSKKGANPGGKF